MWLSKGKRVRKKKAFPINSIVSMWQAAANHKIILEGVSLRSSSFSLISRKAPLFKSVVRTSLPTWRIRRVDDSINRLPSQKLQTTRARDSFGFLTWKVYVTIEIAGGPKNCDQFDLFPRPALLIGRWLFFDDSWPPHNSKTAFSAVLSCLREQSRINRLTI